MKPLLLFDGACGLCTRAAEIAKRIDRRGKFAIEPYQAFSEEQLARFGLTHAQCGRSLRTVTRKQKVMSGAFAVNYFLWRQFPWTLLVVVIHLIPVLLLLEIAAYALVSRHRTCENRGRPPR